MTTKMYEVHVGCSMDTKIYHNFYEAKNRALTVNNMGYTVWVRCADTNKWYKIK